MARKKKQIDPFNSLKTFFSIALIAGAIFLAYRFTTYVLGDSSYFTIKAVVIDPSLAFIDKRDLAKLKGQNIFRVDIKGLRKSLSHKYPQIADLRIIKKFPDQILISAQKRYPMAQVKMKTKTLTLDEGGVILSTVSKQDEDLIFISGRVLADQPLSLGYPVRSQNIQAALRAIKSFQDNHGLAPYHVKQVEVKNLSEINMFLSNNLKVIVDQDKLDHQMTNLSFVLNQGGLDLAQVQYVDLRFRDPIIGRKDVSKNSKR
ncbi:MAG: FtsQ-type POTRA domain-containing protein [Candidatus Omnitrophota bacterium]|nr:FtsQ-type POTRA domain-containing protein [Candidatus Omnitrophota bacterium]